MGQLENEICIIGGGYAGLCAAVALAERGLRVHLLEQEKLLCTHSSARNAAIFRSYEHTEELRDLCTTSRNQLDEWMDSPWLNKTGAYYFGARAGAMTGTSRMKGWNGDHTVHLGAGVFVPDDGVIDIHSIQQRLRRKAQAAGVQFHMFRGAISIVPKRDKGFIVRTASGPLFFPAVVNAAGAWADGLMKPLGLALGLVPLRRHLVHLSVRSHAPDPDAPILWFVGDEEYYLRPEAGGVLASPADEEETPPCLPSVDDKHLYKLGERLSALGSLVKDSSVTRSWACLRTFAADRLPVVGADPRARGLYWMAGLGGRGMTTGAGLAAYLAAEVVEQRETPFSPNRFFRATVPVTSKVGRSRIVESA